MKMSPHSVEVEISNASKAEQVKTVQEASIQAHLDYNMLIVGSEIDFMKRHAERGDVQAADALHRMALKATNALNALDDDKKQQVAMKTEWWPVNLSWVPAWNKNMIQHEPERLGLGKNVSAIFDMEAVLKRGALSKMLGASLVNYVEICRRHGLLIREIREDDGSTNATVHSETERKLVHSFNSVRRFASAVGGFMALDLAPLTQESIGEEIRRTSAQAQKALQLEPLLLSKKSRAAWFDFGMKLIEWFTESNYDQARYCLRGMNRKSHAETPAEIRAGIRQGIKEGFDAVIVNVSPKGFAVVA